ncbi:class I SAM-dependent methyltransferase [Rhodospirillaceae bacterium KN72]|uniref:Class I SAM-dependent methyltransferase n=1 Tax=Pacificispira spongiicola TaxID=2729598 RepID=A0A7Y0E1L9_9PROT|nr:class I SAM-dependent methyltransferase [Pacificispira spongiicola]NMM45583.1 class I SAM-dependent methyltransferase [Pacificispira spongiicola]
MAKNAAAKPVPKETSYEYGAKSQEKMLKKYLNRANNHWSERIQCAKDLLESYARPHLGGRENADIFVVDVGCSVGTFALEFSRDGFRTVGVDFDKAAVAIAEDLAKQDSLGATFRCMDLADWQGNDLPAIDVAVCFDIFEHLHDDEIGALMLSLRRAMAPNGRMIFSTTPTQYSYLWSGAGMRVKVTRFLAYSMRWLSRGAYEKWIMLLDALVNIAMILKYGKTRTQLLKRDKHCNTLTLERVRDILLRANWQVDAIETCNLHRERFHHLKKLERHPITHTHILGAATPK